MIPLKLTIEGFASYLEPVEVDFTGLRRACIIGPNGAGKSTIVSAILWALFGKSQTRKNTDLINTKSMIARVELVFNSNGNEYHIFRELSKKGTKAYAALYLISDGEERQIADGIRDVDNAISRILNLDYDDFISASVLVQGDSARFSKMTPTQRKAFLSKVLGISLCEGISKLARAKVREMEAGASVRKEDTERIEKQISLLEGADERLAEAQCKSSQIDIRLKESKSTLEELRGKQAEIDRTKSEIELCEREIQAIDEDILTRTNELKDNENRLGVISNVLSEKPKIIKQLDQTKAIEEKLNRLEQALLVVIEARESIAHEQKAVDLWQNKLEAEIAVIEVKLKGIRNQIAGIDRDLGKEKELAMKDREFNAIAKTLQTLRLRKHESDKLKEEIIALTTNIIAEKRNIENSRKECLEEIAKKKKALEERDICHLSEEIATIDKALSEEETVKEELEATRKEWDSEKSRKIAIEAEISQVEARIEEESGKLTLIVEGTGGEICPLCAQPLDAVHRERVLADISTAIEIARERTNGLKSKLDAINQRLEDLVAHGKKLSAMEKDLVELHKKREAKVAQFENGQALKEEVELLQSREAILSRKIAEKDFLHKEREHLQRLEREFSEKAPSDDLIKATEDKLESLRESEFLFQRIPELKKQKAQLEQELAINSNEIDEKRKALESKEGIAQHLANIEHLRKAIAETEYDKAEHEVAKEQLKTLIELKDRLHEIERAESTAIEIEKAMQTTKRQISAAQAKRNSVIERCNYLREALPDVDMFRQRLEVAVNDLESIELERTTCAVEFSQAKSNVQTLETLNNDLAESRDKLSELEKKMRIHRLLASAMGKDGVPMFVISHALPEIEREADELLSLISGAEMTIRLTSDDDDFRVLISDADGERPYQSFSGGESFRVDFALRLALSRFLAQRSGAELSLLIIDEGFGTQDAEGLALVSEALRMVEREFSLILVVTHLESMKEEFEQIIEVSKTSRGSSQITVYS